MKSNRWLILILILAAALRLWGLGAESLWLDEALTLRKIALRLPDFVRHFGGGNQTILYYFVEKVWCHIAGTSEWVIRFPSVIYGLAAVWGIFLLGRELFSPAVGLYSALLLAVNPFAIFYSQEARPYALFLAAAVFSVYCLLRVVRSGTRAAQAGYVMTTTVALYTHPLALLLLGVHAVGWWIYGSERVSRKQSAWLILKLNAISVVLFVPQVILMSVTVAAKRRGLPSASWIPLPDLLDFVITIRRYFMHPLLAGAVVAVVIILFAVMWIKNRRLPAALWIPAALIIFCMAAPWIISHALTPVYVDRYTIPALAGFILFLAWSLSIMPLRLRAAAVALLLIPTGFALHGYYAGMDKDPWRETAAEVHALNKPGDVLVVARSYAMPAFLHYYRPPANVTCIAPSSTDGIPMSVDTAARIVFVSAYDLGSNEFQRELQARMAAGRMVVAQKTIAEHSRRNPYAYWISPIRATVYEREVPSGEP